MKKRLSPDFRSPEVGISAYSSPLKKTLSILAAMFYLLSTSGLSGVEKASRISTGKSADHHLRRGGSGQLSPRSPSVADQRVKFQFENFNVECGNLRGQCPKSDVGSENFIKRQMLNVRCKQMNVHSTELEGRIRKLDCCL